MANGHFISYLRVSTKTQGDSGLGLEAQRTSVSRFIEGGACKLIEEVVEVESGKRNDRPKLAEALRLCRVHRATLLVAKLDRLARNVHFISSLMESGVKFVAVDSPQANDMTIHILASVAQGEAAAISYRTRVALAALKERGQQLGGLRSNSSEIHLKGVAQSVANRRKAAASRAADMLPVIQAIQDKSATPLTLQKLADELNRQKIPTVGEKEGSKWNPMQVSRILKTANGKAA